MCVCKRLLDRSSEWPPVVLSTLSLNHFDKDNDDDDDEEVHASVGLEERLAEGTCSAYVSRTEKRPIQN